MTNIVLIQTVWLCKRRQEAYLLLCHLISIQLQPNWKLSWQQCSLCFHHKLQEARLSRYQGTKVKPFDCFVIAQQVYLPVLHHCSAFTCTAPCQEERPLLWERAAESNAGFSQRVNHKASDRGSLLHSASPSNSWQTCTVGLEADSQSRLASPPLFCEMS